MPDEAAFASNWWRILAIDLAIGVGLLLVGVVAALQWNAIAWTVAALGVFYTYLVVRRIFRWRELRRSPRDPG